MGTAGLFVGGGAVSPGRVVPVRPAVAPPDGALGPVGCHRGYGRVATAGCASAEQRFVVFSPYRPPMRTSLACSRWFRGACHSA